MNMDMEKLEIMHKTAEQIKYYRNLEGLSQEALALSAGLNPAFMGHIERSLKCPTIDTLNKIASALNISLSELLDFQVESIEDSNEKAVKKIALLMRNLSSKDAEEIADIVAKIIKFKYGN
jgi:transcriptional regulator with XRE-family HTH domain